MSTLAIDVAHARHRRMVSGACRTRWAIWAQR